MCAVPVTCSTSSSLRQLPVLVNRHPSVVVNEHEAPCAQSWDGEESVKFPIRSTLQAARATPQSPVSCAHIFRAA